MDSSSWQPNRPTNPNRTKHPEEITPPDRHLSWHLSLLLGRHASDLRAPGFVFLVFVLFWWLPPHAVIWSSPLPPACAPTFLLLGMHFSPITVPLEKIANHTGSWVTCFYIAQQGQKIVSHPSFVLLAEKKIEKYNFLCWQLPRPVLSQLFKKMNLWWRHSPQQMQRQCVLLCHDK